MSGAMRVAVTGAAGYLGRLLIRRLDRCDGVERILATDIRAVPPGEFSDKVAFVKHDIRAPIAGLFAERHIDAVAHLAFVINAGRDDRAVRGVNIGGLANVLEGCANSGVRRLLYLSSATVYGAHSDNPPLLTEASPLRPLNGFAYSDAKVEAESLLTDFAARHPDVGVCILRACPILGARADNFIAHNLARRLSVAVSGYDPPMQFLHEDDAADVMANCLLNGAAGIYNIGGRGGIRRSEMAAIAGGRLLRLPAALLYGLTGLSWRLGLQSSSPAIGLDFIRYPWAVSAAKLEREHGLAARYSSREAWAAFVNGRLQPPPNTD